MAPLRLQQENLQREKEEAQQKERERQAAELEKEEQREEVGCWEHVHIRSLSFAAFSFSFFFSFFFLISFFATKVQRLQGRCEQQERQLRALRGELRKTSLGLEAFIITTQHYSLKVTSWK